MKLQYFFVTATNKYTGKTRILARFPSMQEACEYLRIRCARTDPAVYRQHVYEAVKKEAAHTAYQPARDPHGPGHSVLFGLGSYVRGAGRRGEGWPKKPAQQQDYRLSDTPDPSA